MTVNPVTGRAYIVNSDRTVVVLAPSGVSARQAGGPAAATGSRTGGQADGQHRGTCG